ncbi:hypothetical protein K1719_033550 [Acacia pycnantha]|nr:hypothetical protein K1719_033550 [Acacia pycnantha]
MPSLNGVSSDDLHLLRTPPLKLRIDITRQFCGQNQTKFRNMKTGKSKATWDVSSTEIFLEQCIEQIYKKERQGLVFTKQGWKNILSGFNEKAEKSYDKKQLKNRLDSLKKEWRAWDDLFSKETGIAIDYTSNMVIAEDEWWKKKIKENSAYGKYRYNGMKFARELQILFKDVTASRDKMFTPSSTKRMSPSDDKDDLHQPIIDLEEDSCDSEEEFQGANTGGSLQVPTELEGINLTTNTQPSAPSGSGSIAKRKKDEGLSGLTQFQTSNGALFLYLSSCFSFYVNSQT